MYKIDDIDSRILEILKENGRATYTEISEHVHLSRISVKKRIQQMEQYGIIAGFTVQVSSKSLGKPISIFLDIEVEPIELNKIAIKLSKVEDIAIISQHTGNSGIHVHAFIDRIENLPDFVEENIYKIGGIRNVNSYILIKNFKINPWIL